MVTSRKSGEIYSRDDGLKLLEYLKLLTNDVAGYVVNYFSSSASGPDLLSATREFYASAIVQLVQTGEFVPGQEEGSDIVQCRANRFDKAVKETKLKEDLAGGMTLGDILGRVDISKYLRK